MSLSPPWSHLTGMMTAANSGMSSKVGFLIDMDGVIYRGDQLIEGTLEFLDRLEKLEIPYLFLTNNSQRARRDIVAKLSRLGIDVGVNRVFTCAMATARFLASQKPKGTAYVLGENGLSQALHHNGYSIVDDQPDYVVVGEGRTFTYEMIERAVRMIEKGAKLIATNMDTTCPTDRGIRPGCGAIVAMLEKASGASAFSVGKPSPVMMRMARKELGLSTRQTIMVGDTMYTDILGGVQMGYRTVLVLSGHTTRDDCGRYAYQPDLVVPCANAIPPDWYFSSSPVAIAS